MCSDPRPAAAARPADAGRAGRAVARLESGLAGWAFPAALLSTVVLLKAAMLALFLTPEQGALGAFAQDFRRWCFGYDPATGRLEEFASLAMHVWEPIVLSGIVLVVWWGPLTSAWRRSRRQFLRPLTLSAVLVTGLVGCMTLVSEPAPDTGELPFPAEALRTGYAAPEIALVNQAGEAVSLSDLEGRVVLLTAVYATCGHTCPILLTQARAALASLTPEQRGDVAVVAVTLDPANDTPEALARMAEMQDLPAPTWQLLTGAPDDVEAALDAMDVSRYRDPETGIIEHANLFLLIDRSGAVAYRFTIGERQQRWLTTATKLLLSE